MKTYTQTYIEKALEGGWKGHVHDTCGECVELQMSPCSTHYERMFLDPASWHAVGKTMGWKENWTIDDPEFSKLTWGELRKLNPEYQQHLFITALQEASKKEEPMSDVIERFLKTLLK